MQTNSAEAKYLEELQLYEELLKRDAAKKNLIQFTEYTNHDYQAAEHHRLIAEKLEAIERGEIDRLMIFMPPRHGKSELASKRFPAWYLGRNPDKQIIAASYNSDLASDFGREVRNILDGQLYRNIFNTTLAADSRAANRWHTHEGGSYVSAGVGTAITGRGANVALIDDPLKDRSEADSEVTRARIWEWYTSTLYTRLMPGGAIVLIQCMTGDTPVLMAGGTEKPLRDIIVGDEVATYECGKISASKVLNWINQGHDSVYRISMKSGIIVKANERHPFLVDRGGDTEWIKLKNLKVGDTILRVIGESGEGLSACRKGVASLQGVKDFVTRITTRPGGMLGGGHHLLSKIRHLALVRNLSTVTALPLMTIRHCLSSKVVAAPFVGARQRMQATQNIGTISSVLTTATTQTKLGAFFATIATWLSDAAKRRMFLSQQQSTSDFTPDKIIAIEPAGVEDVFDMQVDRTENFIANGLVSSNTRWHDDDLAGRLLNVANGDKWEILELPALSDGKALWPEWYPRPVLDRIRAAIGRRDWSALYQQNPVPDEGDFFKRDEIQWYEDRPKHLKIYAASDYAVTEDGGDWTEMGVAGVDPEDNIYILDWWRGQTGPDEWIEQQLDMVKRHKPLWFVGESGVIRRAIEPMLRKRMRERKDYCRLEWLASISDKPTRARGIQARFSMKKVYLPVNEPWADELLRQMLRFPQGEVDDGIDVLSLFGRMLDKVSSARLPEKQEEEGPKPGTFDWLISYDSDETERSPYRPR